MHQFIDFTKNWRVTPGLTSIRGYHAVVAVILKFFNNTNKDFIRYVCLFLNLISLPVIYLTSKTVDKKHTLTKTVQFGFLPIVFPFFMLMYGDIFSVTWVVLGIYFALKKNYALSGIFATASIFIKQNNVVWLIFTNLLVYTSNNGFEIDKKS